MTKEAATVNNCVRKIGLVLLDGRKDSEHKSVGFVEVSGIFAMYDVSFFGTYPSEGSS